MTLRKLLLTDAKEAIVRQQPLPDLARQAVPAMFFDATTRTELISRMARILVVVYQAEGGRVDDRALAQFYQAGVPALAIQ